MAATKTKATDAPDDAPEETEEQKRVREDNEKEAERQEKERERLEKDGEERMANAPDPENPDDQDKFNSLLTRDTTHFQNVHYDGSGAQDKITGASSANRVAALQALLAATNFNVQAGVGWDYATQKAVMDFQGDDATGEVDRATWDKLSDILFGKGDEKKKEPKPASVPTGG